MNRFLLCAGPHARTPFPFDLLSAVSSNGPLYILRVCSLAELVGEFCSNQIPLLMPTTYMDQVCCELDEVKAASAIMGWGPLRI